MNPGAVVTYLRGLPRQAQTALAGAVLLVLLVLWLLLSPMVGLWVESARDVEALRPRLSRFLGFEESGDVLAASVRRARAQLESLVYPVAGSDAASGAALQQLVRDLADQAGLAVARSQALQPEELEGLVKVRVNLELRGSSSSVRDFLETLATERPVIVVESLRMQPRRERRSAEAQSQVLAVSVRLAAYKVLAS